MRKLGDKHGKCYSKKIQIFEIKIVKVWNFF